MLFLVSLLLAGSRKPIFTHSRIVGLLRSDILVDVEKVIRIVLPLNLRQSIVVVAVGRFDPVDSFFHHEIYVGASQCVGMDGFPIFLGPRRNRFRLAGSGLIPAMTIDHVASRNAQAVSLCPTRWTAPSIG